MTGIVEVGSASGVQHQHGIEPHAKQALYDLVVETPIPQSS
jgi:hypothetical protein